MGKATLEIKDNLVIKTFNTPQSHIDENWLRHYNNFYKYGYTVKVLDANPYQITMEKVEGRSLSVNTLIETDCFNSVHKQYYDIVRCFYDYGEGFYHTDFNDSNFIYTNDDRLILIDPDSFYKRAFIDSREILTPNFIFFWSRHARNLYYAKHDITGVGVG